MKELLLFLCFAGFITTVNAQQVVKTKSTKNTTTTNKPVPVGSSFLYGLFSAPSGSNVLLQNNGKNDLSLTAQKESGKNFSTNMFKFQTPFMVSSNFKISFKKAPAGQTCFIYAGAEGQMPQKENKLRVGCDFTYDLVSRNSNDNAFSTFYE